MLTKAIRRFVRACHVGDAGIVGDEASLLNELVGSSVVASMTRAGHFCSTIENELNGKINIIAFAIASNLDAIG